LMAFYQGIGYSLDGFMEVFYETLHFMEQQGVVCLASGLFEKTAVPSVTYVPPKDLAPNLRPSIGTPVQLHDNDLKRLAALVVGYHDNGNLCLQVFRRGATPSQALDVPYGPHAGCWEPIQ
jgi:hypothetical protein